MTDPTQEALDAIVDMLKTRYGTGIGWISRMDDTIAVDWVNDTTTEYTVTARNYTPAPYKVVRDA